MGKGKKGKKVDVDKKAALQAKKEAKQEKAARKRLNKQQRSGNDNDNENDDDQNGPNQTDDDYLNQVLQAYKSAGKKIDSTKLSSSASSSPSFELIDTRFPLPRANATLEHCSDDTKKKRSNQDFFYLFGGEYFDGIENIVLDDLLRYNCATQEWTQLQCYNDTAAATAAATANAEAGGGGRKKGGVSGNSSSSSVKPSPRCAHSCVSYKQCLYVFGGELATSEQYHHYRDLWKFDVSTTTWTEIIAKDPPSARSGHAAVVWKHYMIIFGGFFEALRDTKWFNDIHVFNLQTETWMTRTGGELPPISRLSMKPEPRSACNIALFGNDKLVIHGGFSKYKQGSSSNTISNNNSSTAEVKVHSDAWVLHLAPILQNKAPTWERWISSSTKSQIMNSRSTNPNGRAGTSSTSYKNRMLVFAGVVDNMELNHHKVESIFYNDIFVLDCDRRKWFPLRVHDKTNKKANIAQGGTKDDDNDAQNDAEEETQDAKEDNASASGGNSDLDLEEDNFDSEEDPDKIGGWDLEMLRSNMFAFVDGDGNIVYEKIEDSENEEEKTVETDEEKEEEKEDDDEDEEKEEEKEERIIESSPKSETLNAPSVGAKPNSNNSKRITKSSVMKFNEETNTPEAVVRTEPLPRINASLLLRGHTLYILGGILEVGDREVTLDDMWSLDLRKRNMWTCLWPGSMHRQVWRGAAHDDDDSYISTGNENDTSDEEDEGSDDEATMDGIGQAPIGNAREKGGTKRSSIRQEIAELNEKYDLSDDQRVPLSGEALAAFYSRTSSYWNSQASKSLEGADTELSNKELKREGFQLAQERYDELRPILERLAELEKRQQQSSSSNQDRRESRNDMKKKTKKDKSKKSSSSKG